MATLASIERQIAALQKKADALRKAETAAAAAKIKALIAQHGLTADDLGLPGATAKGGGKVKVKSVSPKAAGPKRIGVAKYQDPKTGKTWTGVGKPPAWIAGAKNRDKFLIATPGTGSAVKAADNQGVEKPAAMPVKKAKSRVKQPVTTAPAVSEATTPTPTRKTARKPKAPVSAANAAANSSVADAS